MKSADICGGGWAAMYLVASIKQQDESAAIKAVNALDAFYTQPEIKKIWKRIKSLLSCDDEKWFVEILKNNLT